MKAFRNMLAAAAGALLLATAPAAARTATEPQAKSAPAPTLRGPAIWLLEDEDTRIYLFGTTHLLPPKLVWRHAAIDRIIAEADELVMETGDEPEDPPEKLAAQIGLGKVVPAIERVAPRYRATLGEMLAASNAGPETYDGLQTWAVAMFLDLDLALQAYPEDDRPSGDHGVETVLTAIFKESDRPISGVETGEEQMSYFSGLSFREQREFLENTVAQFERTLADEAEAPAAANAGDIAWLSGDLAAIAEEMETLPPPVYEVLLTRRNARWTDWLIARLDRPGKVLFAVGAGHLAGRASVQSMLEARGWNVARIH